MSSPERGRLRGPCQAPHPDLGRQTQTLWKLLPCHRTGEGRRGKADPSSLSPGATMARPCRCHGGRQPGSPRGPPCTCRARCQEGRQSPAGPLGGPRAARGGILFLLELLGARCHPPPGFPSTSGTVPGPGAEGSCPQQPLRKRRPPHRPLACCPTHSCCQAGSHLLASVAPEMCGCRRTRGSPASRFPLESVVPLSFCSPVQASRRDTGASDGPLCEPLDWQARRGSTRCGT